ncbi:hypothetical protein MMC07_007543 [Pseudocyphellaria aurata]|nr:hypothetical protein [Pseudocyphellaria aurata]
MAQLCKSSSNLCSLKTRRADSIERKGALIYTPLSSEEHFRYPLQMVAVSPQNAAIEHTGRKSGLLLGAGTCSKPCYRVALGNATEGAGSPCSMHGYTDTGFSSEGIRISRCMKSILALIATSVMRTHTMELQNPQKKGLHHTHRMLTHCIAEYHWEDVGVSRLT